MLYEAEVRWALGVPTRSEYTWRLEVARRRRIHAALEKWTPPPALGVPPETVTEPITVTLFGINTETINRWLAAEDADGPDDSFGGLAVSPGVAEGVARVVRRVEELDEFIDGEILVCPLTEQARAKHRYMAERIRVPEASRLAGPLLEQALASLGDS